MCAALQRATARLAPAHRCEVGGRRDALADEVRARLGDQAARPRRGRRGRSRGSATPGSRTLRSSTPRSTTAARPSGRPGIALRATVIAGVATLDDQVDVGGESGPQALDARSSKRSRTFAPPVRGSTFGETWYSVAGIGRGDRRQRRPSGLVHFGEELARRHRPDLDVGQRRDLRSPSCRDDRRRRPGATAPRRSPARPACCRANGFADSRREAAIHFIHRTPGRALNLASPNFQRGGPRSFSCSMRSVAVAPRRAR